PATRSHQAALVLSAVLMASVRGAPRATRLRVDREGADVGIGSPSEHAGAVHDDLGPRPLSADAPARASTRARWPRGALGGRRAGVHGTARQGLRRGARRDLRDRALTVAQPSTGDRRAATGRASGSPLRAVLRAAARAADAR